MPIGWYVIDPPVGGQLDADLKKAVAALFGENPSIGTLTATLPKSSAALQGVHPEVGDIAATLPAALANLAGAQVISGQTALTLEKALFAGLGGQTIPGSLTPTIQSILFSSLGSHYNDGVVAASTAKLLATFNAAQIYSATVQAELKAPLTQMSVAKMGPIAASLKKAVASLTAQQILSGSVAVSLPKATATLGGTQTFQGALASAMKKINATMQGGQTQSGAVAATMAKAVAAMSGSHVAGVTVNSVGTAGVNVTANQATISADTEITVVSGSDKRLYVYFMASLNAWIDSWGSHSASSDLDGSLTKLEATTWGNNSGYHQGGIALYELVNPSVGTHTITMSWSYWQGFDAIRGNSICFNGVGSVDTPVKASSGTGTTVQSITVPNDSNDMVIAGLGSGTVPTLSSPWPSSAPDLWYSDGESVSGEGDYINCCYVQGDGTDKVFSGGGSRHGLIGLCLNKV